VHRKILGLPAGTQAKWMAWQPQLNIHQEIGLPQDLGAGSTASLSVKTAKQAALLDSDSHGLHPGAMLANVTKTQKRKWQPIIEISSDEGSVGGDRIPLSHQQRPLKRPRKGENDSLMVQQA